MGGCFHWSATSTSKETVSVLAKSKRSYSDGVGLRMETMRAPVISTLYSDGGLPYSW